MDRYYRKITIDYSKYSLLYSDGDTTPINPQSLTDKINAGNGVILSGITGPSMNMVVSFKQKIKDLGIYKNIEND